MMGKIGFVAAVAAVAMVGEVRGAEEHIQCRTFEQIYGGGKNLCEKSFNGAFRYVKRGEAEYDMAYTMWFFDDENPNNAITQKRLDAGLHLEHNDTSVCHLQYGDKSHPSPQDESDRITECHPWRKEACCTHKTVSSSEVMRLAYGPEWAWDMCGPMSPECARFFVQEACFYECDVNAGLFRKHIGPNVSADDQWQMFGMPIKSDYCDAWYAACRNERFCANGDGNLHACSEAYLQTNPPSPTPAPQQPQPQEEGLSAGAIAAIVILSVLVLAVSVWACLLIRRERKGDPMFKPMDVPDDKPGSSSSLHQTEAQTQEQGGNTVVQLG